LLLILKEARALLFRPENDFAWSSWTDAAAARTQINAILARISLGSTINIRDVEVIVLPTGPMQEASLSSGWSQEFCDLAERFDRASGMP
jgi:hypothetical protein